MLPKVQCGISATHNPSSKSQNEGNIIGTRSTIRQSRYFRMYESGNNMKSILGQDSLVWDVNNKQGAYSGPVYNDNNNYNSNNNYNYYGRKRNSRHVKLEPIYY